MFVLHLIILAGYYLTAAQDIEKSTLRHRKLTGRAVNREARKPAAVQRPLKLANDRIEVPYDDYAGRHKDPMQRGAGRKPLRPVCLFTTKTLLDIVTMTKIEVSDVVVVKTEIDLYSTLETLTSLNMNIKLTEAKATKTVVQISNTLQSSVTTLEVTVPYTTTRTKKLGEYDSTLTTTLSQVSLSTVLRPSSTTLMVTRTIVSKTATLATSSVRSTVTFTSLSISTVLLSSLVEVDLTRTVSTTRTGFVYTTTTTLTTASFTSTRIASTTRPVTMTIVSVTVTSITDTGNETIFSVVTITDREISFSISLDVAYTTVVSPVFIPATTTQNAVITSSILFTTFSIQTFTGTAIISERSETIIPLTSTETIIDVITILTTTTNEQNVVSQIFTFTFSEFEITTTTGVTVIVSTEPTTTTTVIISTIPTSTTLVSQTITTTLETITIISPTIVKVSTITETSFTLTTTSLTIQPGKQAF